MSSMRGYGDDVPDEELVFLYREKQLAQAFEHLWAKYSDVVKKIVYRKVFDEYERKEVIQQISILLFSKIKNVYKEEGKFSAWLKQLVSNYLASYLRGKNTEWIKVDFDFSLLSDSSPSIESLKYKEYCWAAIADALLELSQEEVAVLYKRFFLGWTNQQIADELNLKLSTSIKRIRVLLCRLKDKLQERNVCYDNLFC